jgi:nitrogen fixation NifU-like protein
MADAADTDVVKIFWEAIGLNDYSDKVIEHFMCPQNVYSMPDADAQGSFGDPSCGDALTIFIKVQNNCIQEISYLVFGCCASIATSSMTSVLAKGKSLEDALKITEEDIIEALDGLPENKKHCSNLGITALRNAINNYYMITNLKEVL